MVKTLGCTSAILDLVQFSSVAQSCHSLRPHESQHARPPCPSPTTGVYSDSCPLSQWCHPAISSSVIPFSSCPQSLPASGSFPMSQLLILHVVQHSQVRRKSSCPFSLTLRPHSTDCCLAAQSCPTLHDPRDCSMPGLPILHYPWSLLKLMSIESVMPSNHLILCHLLSLLPSIFPSIRVFSNELALCIRWPKHWSFSLSISSSNE